MERRAKFFRVLSALILMAFTISLVLAPPETLAASKDKKKKIKIIISAPIKNGFAPLPVHFSAQIDAPAELDEEIYKSGYEWVIYGRFVLTDSLSGGDATPAELRNNPLSTSEYILRSNKHLVGRNRVRPPRKPYKPGMEVKKTLEFDYTFDRAGEYFISLRLKHGKYRSNEFRIVVQGDTSYDPLRQR